VPDGVVQYIAKHDLYTATGATADHHPTSSTHRTSTSSSKDSA
jgi:hypothetical protein